MKTLMKIAIFGDSFAGKYIYEGKILYLQANVDFVFPDIGVVRGRCQILGDINC